MKRTIGLLAALAAGGALLMAPAAGWAQESKRCKKPATNVGFVVRGTLTSFSADDTATTANEASVAITVTGANRHARNSGDLVDMDPATAGTQVEGGAFTASASADPFRVQLEDFDAAEVPAAGDSVKIIGKIARTKAKCAAPGTSLADRYGAVNIRKVVIEDAD